MTISPTRSIIALALMIAIGGGTGADAEGQASGSADASSLVGELERLVGDPDGPPGVIVIIQRGGEREIYAAGVAEVVCTGGEWRACPGDPPDIDDHMRIASVSKTFSGAAALTLVSEGTLTLESTIGEVLPDLPSLWHPVTLRQLLAHTSGLPDFTASAAFRERVGAEPRAPPAPRELLAYVADQPLVFDPGSDYRYSNSDNVTVGLMIEEVMSTPYAHALRQRVLEPLVLAQTSLEPRTPLPPHVLHGYAIDEGGAPQNVTEAIAFGGYAWASGGIVSSPDDLNRFVRAYVGGKLFGPVERDEQLRFRDDSASSPPGPGDNAAGLALFRYSTACGEVYGHTGSILGYTQLIAATPDGETSITFSVNAQMGEDMIPALRRAQEAAICLALGR